MVVDLAREIRIIFLRGLEHNLGAIGELVRGKVDLAKAAFANKPTECVIANCRKFGRGKFVEEGLVRYGELEVKLLAIGDVRPRPRPRLAERMSHLMALFLQFVLGLRPDRWH